MRILVVANDFPPTPSPQSIRWAYLARELNMLGHEVEVLCADLPGWGYGGLPETPGEITVHRVFPGPITTLLYWARGATGVKRDFNIEELLTRPKQSTEIFDRSISAKLRRFHQSKSKLTMIDNKFGFRRRIRRILEHFVSTSLYPNESKEWSLLARPRLSKILRTFKPDVVITSHEPASSIPLGLIAKRKGFRWVADLGDPINAQYSSDRWMKESLALERAVMRAADLITLTTEATWKEMLNRQPGLSPSSKLIVTQGHIGQSVESAGRVPPSFFHDSRLELLYTGTFYRFRNGNELFDAVKKLEGVRLTIATINPSPDLEELERCYPEKFRLLGFVPHDFSIEMQRQADVVVNISNSDSIQIPGKFFEYLGSGRPILNIADALSDPTSEFVVAHNAGWAVTQDSNDIAELLHNILKLKRQASFSRAERYYPPDRFRHLTWAASAAKLSAALEQLRN